jgi:two-component system, NtrC family, sensor kinase
LKLVTRISRTFLWIILIAILSSAGTGVLLTVNAIRQEASARVETNLIGARAYLEDKIASLLISAEIVAAGLDKKVNLPVSPDIIKLFHDTVPGELVNSEGPAADGDSGFTLLSFETAEKYGIIISEFGNRVACDAGGLLCFYAVRRGEVGTAFTAVVLNENYALVQRLQKTLFGGDLYRGKPFGTVTIFCNDLRVATTVLGPAGKIAVGTRVSEEVRSRVLDQGGKWLQRAFVVDEWYISAYEPIKDGRGDNIGILYVGVIEKKYVDLRNRIIFYLALLSIPVFALVLFGAFFMSRRIVKPLSTLSLEADRIASGSFDVTISPEKDDEEVRNLAEAFIKMARQLKSREQMLNRKNNELEERNRDYQELLSFVTHELNNSIGSLLLNTAILADGSMGELDHEQQEVANQILLDVQRFKDMVKNYLNLSRMEKGTLPYDPGIIDVRDRVIEPIFKRFERWISHNGFRVEWEWEENITVYGDQNLLDIAFSNLFVNALKYGKDWIKIRGTRDETGVLMSVSNGGPLIPEEKISLLFQKFSRLVKSDDGVGLGLYLVKMVVEQQNGEVWCEADAQNGTTFYIRISST